MIKGGGLKHVPCVEDEDFIQALDKMMLENLQVKYHSFEHKTL
jgi:regulator of nonsense transcripts 2